MSADKVTVQNIVYAARRNGGAPRRILDDVSFAAPDTAALLVSRQLFTAHQQLRCLEGRRA